MLICRDGFKVSFGSANQQEVMLTGGSSPIAGAQYHWGAEHSPPRRRALISYVQGWVTVTGWVAAVASVCFLIASMIQAMAVLNYPGYEPKRWHATLIMIAFSGSASLGITFGKKFLPLWETLGGLLHVAFFVVFISVLATSTKARNKDVWGTFINVGGWSSDGISFCIGFLTRAFALAGIDAVVHMSEEAHNAPLNIPRAMVYAVVINGIAGFTYIIAVLYAITDADSVLSTPTGLPIIAVFLQATNNQKAATAIITAVKIVFSIALFGSQLRFRGCGGHLQGITASRSQRPLRISRLGTRIRRMRLSCSSSASRSFL